MKRSEMLIIIEKMLHNGPDYPTSEEILNKIEELGMLPPGKVITVNGIKLQEHKWENE